MWRVNQVVLFEDKTYRILYLDTVVLFWMDIHAQKGFPESVSLSTMHDRAIDGLLLNVDDPFSYLQSEVLPKETRQAQEFDNKYKLIAPIIIDEGMFYKEARAERVSKVLDEYKVGKATIYRLLRRYWQRGQIKAAMLSDYKNSGGAGKRRQFTTQKPGPRRQFGKGDSVAITEGIRKLFRRSIEKHLMNDKGRSIQYAYRQFSKAYLFHNPEATEENKPTFRQFDFFYQSEYTKAEKIDSQTSSITYNKDVRPMHGTATEQALGPGSRYEIDATIADIYLVSDSHPDDIIGRPTIYFVIDVFSRMVTGFYIGFDNPSYPVAMKALVSSFGSKVDICKRYGITIDDSQWPCLGIPDVVLADKGELMGHQSDYLVKSLCVNLENSASGRSDAKGIVERSFNTVQAKFKPFLPGVVTGSKIKKHGDKDYRVEAIMTMHDFVEIIIFSLLSHNQFKPLRKYDRARDIPASVPSIPLHLWNWGLQNRTGKLRSVDINMAQVLLLPRKRATISEDGVKLWGVLYTSQEVLKAGWLHRDKSVNRPQGLFAAYDLGSANYIYLFSDDKSNNFWVCDITSRSREFRDMTWYEVWERQAEHKQTHAQAQNSYVPVERELDLLIEEKVKKAKKIAKARKNEASSHAERIRKIKQNKRKAREEERRDTAIKPARSTKESADVIPIADKEESYKLPTFIPELFDDDEDK